MRGVSLEGYAGSVYRNSNIPPIVRILKSKSAAKNAADYLMTYRAGTHACEYEGNAEKPAVVIISRDSGLQAVVVMLKVCPFLLLDTLFIFCVRESYFPRIFVVHQLKSENFSKVGTEEVLQQNYPKRAVDSLEKFKKNKRLQQEHSKLSGKFVKNVRKTKAFQQNHPKRAVDSLKKCRKINVLQQNLAQMRLENLPSRQIYGQSISCSCWFA